MFCTSESYSTRTFYCFTLSVFFCNTRTFHIVSFFCRVSGFRSKVTTAPVLTIYGHLVTAWRWFTSLHFTAFSLYPLTCLLVQLRPGPHLAKSFGGYTNYTGSAWPRNLMTLSCPLPAVAFSISPTLVSQNFIICPYSMRVFSLRLKQRHWLFSLRLKQPDIGICDACSIFIAAKWY